LEPDKYKSYLNKDKSNAIFRANRAMAEFKKLRLPNRLLDVGCGTGELLKIAKENGVANLVGIDGLQEALDQCQGIQVNTLRVDLNSSGIPVDDGSFDGVTCLEVLEHLYAPQTTLREIFRVTQKGGWVIISVPNPLSYSMRVNILFGKNISDPTIIGGHIKFFRSNDLQQICQDCGFQGIKVFGIAYPTAYEKYGLLTDFLVKISPSLFSSWFFACCQKPLR
jgi:2-polyprenyl-6-hydroxyphenyl methylase/3-demethylubiquinone-9 3-methyltransferase